MKIENTETYGWRRAFTAMRYPQDSNERSDSRFITDGGSPSYLTPEWGDIVALERPYIGPKDLQLACDLIAKGGPHRKFIRMIMIWWDISISRFAWTEYDTYKVATVRMSRSTMNKLWNRDLTPEDFDGQDVEQSVLDIINKLAAEYRDRANPNYKSLDYLARLKRRLPEGFILQAGYLMSYETAMAMWYWRNKHRNAEWREGICKTIEKLPYMENFLPVFETRPDIRREVEEQGVQNAIDVLNQAVAADPASIQALFAVRHPANAKLIDHPTIQVISERAGEQPRVVPDHTVGVMGLINGLFGVGPDGYGKITSIWDDNGNITRFERTVHNHQ